jgi:hypothetical protein
MARHEQKLTVQSPLSQLVKPAALRQDTLPGLPSPVDSSPFSMPRLTFMLRRPVESIKAFKDRVGRRWHILKTEQKEVGFSSSLFFAVVDTETVVTTSNTIRGKNIKMTQEGNAVLFTSETGATIKYTGSGASVNTPSPLRRQIEQAAQQDTPWYLKTADAVGRAGLRLENIEAQIIQAPETVGITKNNTPVARFKLRILGTDAPVELTADAYNDKDRERGGNPYRVQQTINKHLQAGDTVLLTGHYHIDRTQFQNETGVKPYERKWIRLLVIDKKPTG